MNDLLVSNKIVFVKRFLESKLLTHMIRTWGLGNEPQLTKLMYIPCVSLKHTFLGVVC